MKKLNRIKESKLGLSQTLVFIFNKLFFPFFRGIFRVVLNRNIKFPLFVGKSTRLLHASKLNTGRFCYIGDFGYLNFASYGGVTLGNNVTIREFCWLQLTSTPDMPGETIIIGDNTYIGPRVNLGGAAKLDIGSCCQIGAGVSFVAEGHNYADERIFEGGVTRKGITIGDDCWIGNNAVILDGVVLEEGVVVGAGAVVTKSFSKGAVIAGVPAVVVKDRGL